MKNIYNLAPNLVRFPQTYRTVLSGGRDAYSGPESKAQGSIYDTASLNTGEYFQSIFGSPFTLCSASMVSYGHQD